MSLALRFTGIATAVTLVLLAVGVVLTRNADPGVREALIWACGIVWAGSILGVAPLVVGAAEGVAPGPAGVSRFLVAMLLRLGAVGVGAVAVVLLGDVDVQAFLLGLAVSYLVFLVIDTAFALRVFGRL